MQEAIPIIDLFAGPGGLGEGFSSTINDDRPFRISISVEKDPVAHKTLSLRAFYRHFKYNKEVAPDEYYQYLRGDISREQLEEAYPLEWSIAYQESLCAELGSPDENHQPLIDANIEIALGGKKDWVLIGGPPCQAYSLIGRNCILGYLNSERTKRTADEFNQDHRHQLYKQYLRIIAIHSPAVFVMENVKGILSSKQNGEKIFPRILKDLRNPSTADDNNGWQGTAAHKYSIVSFVTGKIPDEGKEREYLIEAENYGVPQARHRVILLGIREDIFEKINGDVASLAKVDQISLTNVIKSLPKLRSGFSKSEDTSEHWKSYFQGLENASWLDCIESDVRKEVDKSIRILSTTTRHRKNESVKNYPIDIFNRWYSDKNLKGLSNHETRSHMDSDLSRYLFVSAYGMVKGCSPRLKDFPVTLLPAHNNVVQDALKQKFADRFKVQIWDKPASTITCHISKDSHYFIHPDPVQCRGLTVREAARIQTFPDNYFFEGGRTQQYHQVGNAVPPLLAKQLAEIVYEIFKKI